MQVAVACVRVVERSVHVVVDVVAVRDGRGSRVTAALDRRARPRAPAVHVEAVLVGVPFVRRVQVALVQVVRVVAVADGFVAAALAVAMRVLSVLLAAHGLIVAPSAPLVNRGIIW